MACLADEARAMNHYCTYFDRGYLAQGLALWTSLVHHDARAVLWVLALDAEAADALRALGQPRLRVLALGDLLAADSELAAVQSARPRNEFIFSLTPCLVRWLWQTRPEIEVLAYLDADVFFFADPAPIWRELGTGSVLLVPHRFPAWHDDAAWYGKFNVGVLVFRSDPNGRACVEWWRQRCLESCALEGDGIRYGDQKYLDEWPKRFAGVVESKHGGVNAAPWNWAGLRWEMSKGANAGAVCVDGMDLIVFHFAQFRRVGANWFDSGQLEYSIMPMRLRSRLYGEYWTALVAAEARLQAVLPRFTIASRGWRASLGEWRMALLRVACGQFWWKVGPYWFAGRLGLGRWVGRAMGVYRRGQRRAAKS